MMRTYLLLLLFLLVGFSACETTSPFDQGPAYDFEGNLAIDRKKIDAYLDTPKLIVSTGFTIQAEWWSLYSRRELALDLPTTLLSTRITLGV